MYRIKQLKAEIVAPLSDYDQSVNSRKLIVLGFGHQFLGWHG
jgi:hypothetical protein